jgi:pSer/pThr/pTyr-binding forkhead associated (FHA) protein
MARAWPCTTGSPSAATGLIPAPDIVIADEYLSSPHVRFWPEQDRWLAEDLASTNGTWLYGTERVYGPVVLHKGDTIRIGRTVLTVVPF